MSLGTEKPEHQTEQAAPIVGRLGAGRSTKAEPLIRRVFYSPSELRAGWRLCIFIVLVFTLIKSGNLLVRDLLHGADHTILYLAGGVLDFLVLVFVSWMMGRIEGRTIADYGLPRRSMFRAQFWQGALLGFAIITCLLVVMRLVGSFYFGRLALHGVEIWKWGIAYALVFSLVALLEEFGARGYALFTLSNGIGFWPAAIISAVLFSYAHHSNAGEDWIGLVNVGLFGLLACLLLRRTGNLWMPIGLHMAFDWGETFFYGVANSGEVYPGRLFNSSSSGSAWLSGGTVGPEGSVLYTFLLVVAWLICARWLREIKYPRPAPFQNSLSNLQ